MLQNVESDGKPSLTGGPQLWTNPLLSRNTTLAHYTCREVAAVSQVRVRECMCARQVSPVAGQHGGTRGLGLRGGRVGGVAGESALRHHPRQEGLVLADDARDAHGVIWEKGD